MINESVADSYSQAIIDIAVAKDDLDGYFGDFKKAVELFRKVAPESGEAGFFELRIPPPVKKNLTIKLLKDKVRQEILSFFLILVDNNREEYLIPILSHLTRKVDAIHNVVHAKLILAFNPDEGFVAKISDDLSSSIKKTVEIEVEIKPEIVGGFIIIIGDTIIDYSLSGQLEKIRKRMHAAAIS